MRSPESVFVGNVITKFLLNYDSYAPAATTQQQKQLVVIREFKSDVVSRVLQNLVNCTFQPYAVIHHHHIIH
jgi:hypothetical protein